MGHYYWNDWYTGWGWFLWLGLMFLIAMSFGNWGYTYRAHKKYDDLISPKSAIDLLNERYARGEINHDQYLGFKSRLGDNPKLAARRVG
jgi:putative membrane protein